MGVGRGRKNRVTKRGREGACVRRQQPSIFIIIIIITLQHR